MKKSGARKVPSFQSLDEERKYWEKRGPLAEGRKGRAGKPKPGQKRSSFLVVRLTGEELTRLRDVAASQGVGPSTFARQVLATAIERKATPPRRLTLDEWRGVMEKSLPQSVKDKLKALSKSIAVGDPENPSLLLMDAMQMKEAAELFVEWLKAGGIPVTAGQEGKRQEAKVIAGSGRYGR